MYGVCPCAQELIREGLYKGLAVAFFECPHREVSIALFAKRIGAKLSGSRSRMRLPMQLASRAARSVAETNCVVSTASGTAASASSTQAQGSSIARQPLPPLKPTLQSGSTSTDEPAPSELSSSPPVIANVDEAWDDDLIRKTSALLSSEARKERPPSERMSAQSAPARQPGRQPGRHAVSAEFSNRVKDLEVAFGADLDGDNIIGQAVGQAEGLDLSALQA